MTLEKEILEEFIRKVRSESHSLLPVNEDHQEHIFRCLIQLTHSKIIERIDKRILKHDRALGKLKKKNDELYQKLADGDNRANRKMEINDRVMSMIKSSKEELESLKKEVLKNELK